MHQGSKAWRVGNPVDLKRAFVGLIWGCSALAVTHMSLPDPQVASKGSVWLLDEFYVAAATAGGKRDWTRGMYLSNAAQAAGMLEWLARRNLRAGSDKACR